jgi:hypothetical protein
MLLMTKRPVKVALLLSALLLVPVCLQAQPGPDAVSGFNSYIAGLESRLESQHASPSQFLAPLESTAQGEARLRSGELVIEQLSPSPAAELPGALLHHWRGTAFAPGAKAADFERLMKNFDAYLQRFSPQVLQARTLSHSGNGNPDQFRVWMRVRQQHIITIVMDTTYNVTFARLDSRHGYSISRSTGISEIDSPGTASERALPPGEDHGMLWRLNTYWSYEERGDGLYMQVETVSLTRSIPRGLGWVVGPYVESVPRESLEFTLRSACNALKK